MLDALLKCFDMYPQSEAPFMHQQLATWRKERPLTGLRVLHHTPVVMNTLLKIACLVAAGADVTVTNTSSVCPAHPDAVARLIEAGIQYVDTLESLRGLRAFDLYFDCGAELYKTLGPPKIGAIELTQTGDQFYRHQILNFPVISIDKTLTKQIETIFGCAESCHLALNKLTEINHVENAWLIFGFGKIGRGLAYYCTQHKVPVVVVDICKTQRQFAENLGIKTVDPSAINALRCAIENADVIMTATGKAGMMSAYPKAWFKRKILANLGAVDEFGPAFSPSEVLNDKKAINFILKDPTPMKYIDPAFFLHNRVALSFLEAKLSNGMHEPDDALDKAMIQDFCHYHSFSLKTINTWFISRAGGAIVNTL